jgi:hypothetical protein
LDAPADVTTTLREPTVPAGVTQEILVALTTETFVHAAPPIVTVEPLAKFVPVMSTDVPPAAYPDDGLMAVTVGAAAGLTTAYSAPRDVPAVSKFSSKLDTQKYTT